MSKQDPPQQLPLEAEATPQQAHKLKLLKKYGETILSHGITELPNLLFRYQAELQITPTELNVIIQLWTFWWNQYPFPTMETIAQRMNRQARAIRYHISRLKNPQFDEEGVQTRARLIAVKERFHKRNRGQQSNVYDFSPLLDILEALVKRDEPQPKGGTPPATNYRPPRQFVAEAPGNLLPTESIENESIQISKDRFESSKRYAQTQKEGVRTDDPTHRSATQENTESRSNNSYNGTKSATQNKADEYQSNTSKEQGNGAGAEANERPGRGHSKPVRPYLPIYLVGCITEFSREFHDEEHIKSNLTQCANLYAKAGIDEYAFGEIVYQAREITKQARGIHKESQDREKFMGSVPHLNRMPYFFKVLRDLLMQKGLIQPGESEASK